MFENIFPIDINDIQQENLPNSEYYREEFTKGQIVLHHTVSGPGIEGDVSSWLNDGVKVATFVIIDRQGVCHQMFSSKYWAHHLGCKAEYLRSLGITDWGTRNMDLNRHSIGIELDNWGALREEPDGLHTVAYGNRVDVPVVRYETPYRGSSLYEAYTIPQLTTLGSLLLYLCNKYDIPFIARPSMFQVSLNAIRGERGIWTHASYREDKSDCHPDPKLIEMLGMLSQ